MTHHRPTDSGLPFGTLVWGSALALSGLSWWAMWTAMRVLTSQVEPGLAASLIGDAGLATALVGAAMSARSAVLLGRSPVPAGRPNRRG